MIWKLIGLLQKRLQIYVSISISIVSMIIETLTLVMIYELVLSLEERLAYVTLDKISNLIGQELPEFEVSLWAIYVGLMVILSNVVRAINRKLIIHITFDCELRINEIIFARKLLGSYERFISENRFDDQKEVLNEASIVVVQSIMSLTFIFLGCFQIFGTLVGLILTDPQSSVLLFGYVTLAYLLVFFLVIGAVKKATIIRSLADTQRIGTLNEAFANIKQIKVSKDERIILSYLSDCAKRYTVANARAKWLGIAPRFFVEGLVLASLAFFAAISIRTNGSVEVPSLASLTLIVVAAGRLVPAAQQIYSGAVNIGFASDATARILKKVTEQISDRDYTRNSESRIHEPFEIKIENLTFKYPSVTEPAIQNLNLNFLSGRLNYLIGKSGCGKSTVCDLITGLLPPKEGRIAFQSIENGALLNPIIRYVPQDSFLHTGSVLYNLLGTDAPDSLRLQKAEQLITAFGLSNVEEGARQFLSSQVKEFGLNFSGGQKQRLSIIRGLLQEANVLILDEAFSAMDSINAQSVQHELQKIIKPDIMIIIITHDTSLIGNNDYVELEAIRRET